MGAMLRQKSAQHYLRRLQTALPKGATIASLGGRYYALDRDNRWDRVALAYDAMVNAKATSVANAQTAIADAYAADTSDEFIKPVVLDGYEGMKIMMG